MVERQSSLRDDLFGGLVSASVSIPLAMGYGMFAFTALGDSYFAYGSLAGLYAAIAAGVVGVVLGDRTTTVYAPRITTNFLLGSLLYYLVHSDAAVLRGGNVHLVVLAFFSIIFLGGLFQAIFGLVRLGSLIRFTPHPVLAGLQNAAAAILFLVQLADVCGFDNNIPFMAVFGNPAEIKPLSVAVAFVTFVAMWRTHTITTKFLPLLGGFLVGTLLNFAFALTGSGAQLGSVIGLAIWKTRTITAKIPPLLVGLCIGTSLYFVLILTGFGAQLGPVIGMPAAVESPTPYRAAGGLPDLGELAELLPLILRCSLTLALVAAIDALLCAKLITPAGAKKSTATGS
jgi:sulfate permease, SulP family